MARAVCDMVPAKIVRFAGAVAAPIVPKETVPAVPAVIDRA